MRWVSITLPTIQHEKHGGKRTVLKESHGPSLLCLCCFRAAMLSWTATPPFLNLASALGPVRPAGQRRLHVSLCSCASLLLNWQTFNPSSSNSVRCSLQRHFLKGHGKERYGLTGMSQANLGLLPLCYTQSSVCPSHGWELTQYTWQEKTAPCKFSEQLPVQVMILLLCNKKCGVQFKNYPDIPPGFSSSEPSAIVWKRKSLPNERQELCLKALQLFYLQF